MAILSDTLADLSAKKRRVPEKVNPVYVSYQLSPKSGHDLYREYPETIALVIKDFLKEENK
ncbi:hypothetical protein ACVRXS_02245 [Streptococcus orisratti]|uniref:hypothetical protein n=1 Tax=Streptococcus orisratti TaxID=114652 RepID=UPI000361DC94|nr:hypothetical protein [Streptococcus orisratti]